MNQIRNQYRLFLLAIIFFVQTSFGETQAFQRGSNIAPLSFGSDQTIVDLSKIVWEPLKVKGLPKGAEIAVLRGNLETGFSESLLRLPPGYSVPNHNHTSDELYVWIQGPFTLTTQDNTETKFAGPAYINFPGNAPPHALKCGSASDCILYLRYSRPFDINYFSKQSADR